MIKADPAAKVKAAILTAITLLGLTHHSLCLAADTKTSNSKEAIGEEADELPPIDAEEFKVTLTKKSTSGRVLLLEDPLENNPKPGKILLLKSGDEEISAVRVLKNYTGKFAAKIVLPFQRPSVGSEYRALKKIGDKLIDMIAEREKRLKNEDFDLPPGGLDDSSPVMNPSGGEKLDAQKSDDELAREVAPDDNELDRGVPKDEPTLEQTPKKPKPLFDKDGEELTPESIEVQDEDEPLPELTAQEEAPLDPYLLTFTGQFALMTNVDKDNNPATYNSGGGRIGISPLKRMLFKKSSLQDSLSLEVGAFYYSIAGFQTSADQVTLVPVVGTLRYNLHLGQNFIVFGYGGIVKNFLFVDQGTMTESMENLQLNRLAAGGGLMIRLGPGWFARADLGIDMLAFGISLRL